MILFLFIQNIVQSIYHLPKVFFFNRDFYCIHNKLSVKKSLIRETKQLLTDADSSTDTTVGWTKNTHKPSFFE